MLVTVVRVLPGVGRRPRSCLTRCRAATVQRAASPCAVPMARAAPADELALETGQGPHRPSDRPRPAGCRIEGRCLLGGRALPVSHPRGRLPHLRATTAVGPGTRTALAHCAVPGPKPAVCVAEGDSVAGVLWWTALTLVAPPASCQPAADLRRCAKPQVGAALSGRRLFPVYS